MGGHIWVDSDGLGKGCTATFVVRLGVCDAAYQQPPAMPLVWPDHASSDPSGGQAAARREERGMSNLKPTRYQRSI